MTDSSSAELLRRPFWHYFKKFKVLVTLGLTWLFLTNLFETLVPWLLGKTIDKIAAEAPLHEVARTIYLIFGVIVFLSLFRFLWRVFWARFHHSATEDLRDRIYERMVLLGPSFFRPRKIGELLSLVTNDTNSFRMGLGPGFLILFDGIFMIGLILPMMISISATWTWQTLVLMPIVPFMARGILKRLHVNYQARQDRFSDLSGSAQEIVSGIRTIKSFAQEHTQTRQFNVHSRAFEGACNRAAWWDSLFGPSLELPMALGCVILLLLGAPKVMRGEVTLGAFFAFYQYIQRMIWPMSSLGIGLGQIKAAQAAFRRIKEVLCFEPDIPDSGEVELTHFESLEVRDLSFTYPGGEEPALKNLSFILKRGESLGIVGMTGAGKSTLIELLTRQIAVPSGTVLINGISIEKIRLVSLRQLMSVVPQEAFLFSRQVDENLALGLDEWSLQDVQSAAREVRLDAEIEGWPLGYQALVGERGVNLSGGQKQRMTLARATLRKTPIVILDDSLSAVDAKTEAAILDQLRSTLNRTTSIIVSHRLASVRGADYILVLNQGGMEAFGRHDELILTSKTYQCIHAMQMGART